jgi:hypothetical protein
MPRRISERGMVRRATPLVFEALSLSKDRCRFTHELSVGHSIADLVILHTRNTPLWPSAPLTIAESAILSCLRLLKEADIDTIAESVFLRAAQVRTLLLGRLSAWKLARTKDKAVFRSSTCWVDRSEVIAVEAKLTRWREALAQAAVYRRYADRVFVLLPAGSAELAAEHKDSFLTKGVGLLSYDSGTVYRVFSSQKATEHAWHREFALSRIR